MYGEVNGDNGTKYRVTVGTDKYYSQNVDELKKYLEGSDTEYDPARNYYYVSNSRRGTGGKVCIND